MIGITKETILINFGALKYGSITTKKETRNPYANKEDKSINVVKAPSQLTRFKGSFMSFFLLS